MSATLALARIRESAGTAGAPISASWSRLGGDPAAFFRDSADRGRSVDHADLQSLLLIPDQALLIWQRLPDLKTHPAAGGRLTIAARARSLAAARR